MHMSAPQMRMQPLRDVKHLGLDGKHACFQVKEIEAQITGEFPAWLDGTLLRNGPGTFQVNVLECL
jgi:carotenoid cleavage dioxygenase-like enzyme